MAVIRVGIPRALLYYQYFPMWKTFFERLGAEVVVSSPTNKTVLNLGISRAVADTCLPVKIFLGHVISLIEKCDCIFIPAVTSLGKKTYNCSKIIGLPNMARALIPECPVILATDQISKGLALAKWISKCLLLYAKLVLTYAKFLRFLLVARFWLDEEGVVIYGIE